ncbi:hypothetical protein DSL64_17215 [Dyadobacter luteus]|uniref:Mycothiol-dependent maleylpyruvate isomerase metal-binding domain-containing protein n=1 Tax=Dyadobacter luteus TaxID=2259619 RepID=A0A3D8Y9Q6_9BACT|nr:maleylpyruvate isomerase N-terminal domain-containing protein [Dyadobacter luteus]REA59739.1 hypothetical protein DSL64_17215 [Dyadobacter luteus]
MIETRHLFPILDEKLIELLRSLTEEDWNKPTVAKLWTVRDVASHLLDGNMRMISLFRDGHGVVPDRPIHSYQDLVAFLNELNADWVRATKRLSPSLLTDLLETTGREYSRLIQQHNPDENAVFPVAWAGEDVSKNWFHVAREYTEKWHHQQQIRLGTGKPGIMTKDFYMPFIHTLLLGLPHVYRDVTAPPGTALKITISGEAGGVWFLVREESAWSLQASYSSLVTATIAIPAEIAWQLFTKAVRPEELESIIILDGDRRMAVQALTLIAVMA